MIKCPYWRSWFVRWSECNSNMVVSIQQALLQKHSHTHQYMQLCSLLIIQKKKTFTLIQIQSKYLQKRHTAKKSKYYMTYNADVHPHSFTHSPCMRSLVRNLLIYWIYTCEYLVSVWMISMDSKWRFHQITTVFTGHTSLPEQKPPAQMYSLKNVELKDINPFYIDMINTWQNMIHIQFFSLAYVNLCRFFSSYFNIKHAIDVTASYIYISKGHTL